MSTSKPDCEEYEKPWKGICVDKNLEDDWLQRLNDLQAFDLISICEGHANRRPGSAGSYPHLNLRLKEHLLPAISDHWDEYKGLFLNQVDRLFQTGDTLVNMEVKFKLRLGVAKISYRENLSLKIRNRLERTSPELDPETFIWFQSTVERVENLDLAIASLVNKPMDSQIEEA